MKVFLFNCLWIYDYRSRGRIVLIYRSRILSNVTSWWTSFIPSSRKWRNDVKIHFRSDISNCNSYLFFLLMLNDNYVQYLFYRFDIRQETRKCSLRKRRRISTSLYPNSWTTIVINFDWTLTFIFYSVVFSPFIMYNSLCTCKYSIITKPTQLDFFLLPEDLDWTLYEVCKYSIRIFVRHKTEWKTGDIVFKQFIKWFC